MKAKHPPAPTIQQLCSSLRNLGVDRGTLVRKRLPDRQPGLFVAMLSAQSIRDVGSFCNQVAQPLALLQDPKQKVFFGIEVPLMEVFAEMDRLTLKWAHIHIPEIACLAAIFVGGPDVGGIVDGRLCMELTRRNCPTSLD